MLILLILPLALLVILFLLGYAQLYRALNFFINWIALCSIICLVLLIFGFFDQFSFEQIVILVLIAGFLFLPSVWFATYYSVVTSPKMDPPPIEKIYNEYQKLEEPQKEKLQLFAKVGLRLATKHGSDYLRKKGHHISAEAIDEVNKNI